jgi:hypothetical protein
MLVEELFQGWIKARQGINIDPDETAISLITWMEDDPCGFCHNLEHGVVKMPDKKGLAASEKGDLSSLIELWLEHKAFDPLVSHRHRITDDELEALSHYRTKPLARKLKRSHPDVSARVYRALCMRIVNAGKSKYCDAALDHIEHAKKCYTKAGLTADRQAVVQDQGGFGFQAAGMR